jgi:hypothetical protein|tara:strand:+ start:392 stop:643 length:252 start_codon:yes stop_codon:yes gene_type:complete
MRTTDERHSAKFNKMLKGRKIDSCRYVTRAEADDMGWYKRPLVIVFTDGSYLMLQCDDEGNDGGAALFEYPPKEDKYEIIYTI